MRLRKKIVILLTLTFLLNSYSVATATELIGSAAFGNMIRVQSPLLNISFGIYLPLKLLGTFISEARTPVDSPSSAEPGKKTGHRNAAATGCAILPGGEGFRDLWNPVDNCADLSCSVGAAPLAVPVSVVALQDTGQENAALLMLLLYIICLSLSNLPLSVFTHACIRIRSRLWYVLQAGFYFAQCYHDRALSEYDFGGNHVF